MTFLSTKLLLRRLLLQLSNTDTNKKISREEVDNI